MPCDVRSVAAARRLCGPLRSVAGDLRVVARESRPGLAPADVAAHLSLPLATRLAIDPKVPSAMDDGRFAPRRRSPLSRAANDILDLFDPLEST